MHLEHYHCEHYGKLPEVIFMSSKLFYILGADYMNFMLYDTPDGQVYMFHRVPVKVYSSDKLEYYLVESGGGFD
jgi:hypothetical protein